jgi:hypothetical protein
MNNRTPCFFIAFLTTLSAVTAGTFTNAFDSGQPSGTAVYGNAVVLPTAGVDSSGGLQMTTNAASQSAGFIINDLDAGAQIAGFTASFQLLLGGGTTTLPADGFSFNFANNLPNGTMSEDGGGTGLSVEFDTYSNGASDDIGIDIHWQGAIIATYPMTDATLALWPQNTALDPSYWATVFIQLHPDGTLDLVYNGNYIYFGQPTGFIPTAGRFGLGARTGGSYENCVVDNLGITTTPPSLPQFMPSANAPTGTNVRPDPLIIAQMWDGSTAQVDTNTIVMTLNALPVTPTITQTNSVTTVQYQVPPMLPPGSTNTVVVTFADNSASPATQTNQFSFVVFNYLTIPAKYAATADTTSPGFTQRIFQGGTATVGSIAGAENLLGGFLIDPSSGMPFPNTAQTNTGDAWTFVQTNVLNYNISAPASAGDFPGDVQFPGMPGTNGSTVNFALEAITYLYLTPGPYTFGVNSDDGFQLSCLDKQLGVFDAGRGAADSLFSFAVAQTGYYPFRLVYFQGVGGASLEWFSVTPSGQKIPINDTNTPGYIPAYSRATTSLPYFLGSWPGGTGNRPDQPIRVQMQNGAGISVNAASIHMTVNGAAVTPSITQNSGLTTVQYSTVLASGSANTAMVWFADNEGSPISQTNQFTFSAITYVTIPASYALSGGAVDTTKPGFAQKVFQTDQLTPYSIANAEIMLAGQLTDAAGNPYPNKAATNTDGTWNYTQTNVLNYNIAAPANAGDFTNDVKFPGIPGPSGSTNTFALENITYLYLPVGYYVLGVNSDDGFRLTSAPNPHEEFPFEVALFDGTRGAADTTGGFAITQAGYYPFRLVYFQATGPASLELFSVALSGQKILVNDTNTAGAVLAYRSATDTRPYVQWAYPYRTGSYFVSASNPIDFTLVNGNPAILLNTIQLSINGTAVTPAVTQANGTNVIVSYVPSAFQQITDTTNLVQLVWADASGHYNTNAFSFVIYGSESLAPVWNLLPGSRPYLTNDTSASPGAMEAGMAYNPVTGHLVLCSITNGTSVRGFYILDAATGNDVGQLKLTNASGTAIFAPSGSYPKPGYSVGVADDGAIYAADRKEGSFFYYKIYRWANETSVVNVAYSETFGHFAYPLGWDFRVRGAGTHTQIIVGAGLGGSGSLASSNLVLFTTTDGVNFTDKIIGPVTGVTNDLFAGIAFGSNNTCYAEGFPGTALRHVGYDPVAKTGSALATYPWAAPSGSLGPLGVDLVNGRIVALATSNFAGTNQTVNLFDINALTMSAANSPVNSRNVPTSNANPTGSGTVAFTPSGNMVFVLDSQNGLMAYELTVAAAPNLEATITQVVRGNPLTISGIGPAGHPFVLISSTNAATRLNQWTPEQTNTAGTGSFSFSVSPGTVPAKFFRVVTE